jgi:hypothetical protein
MNSVWTTPYPTAFDMIIVVASRKPRKLLQIEERGVGGAEVAEISGEAFIRKIVHLLDQSFLHPQLIKRLWTLHMLPKKHSRKDVFGMPQALIVITDQMVSAREKSVKGVASTLPLIYRDTTDLDADTATTLILSLPPNTGLTYGLAVPTPLV